VELILNVPSGSNNQTYKIFHVKCDEAESAPMSGRKERIRYQERSKSGNLAYGRSSSAERIAVDDEHRGVWWN
jgi:hypothetical protein